MTGLTSLRTLLAFLTGAVSSMVADSMIQYGGWRTWQAYGVTSVVGYSLLVLMLCFVLKPQSK